MGNNGMNRRLNAWGRFNRGKIIELGIDILFRRFLDNGNSVGGVELSGGIGKIADGFYRRFFQLDAAGSWNI